MSSRREAKAFLALVFGAGLYLACVSLGAPGIACPIERLLGLACPGCGITRSGMALLRLDLAGAVRWNPLVLFIVPYVLLRTVESVSVIRSGRPLPLVWPRWWGRGVQAMFILTWTVLATTRITAWIRDGM